MSSEVTSTVSQVLDSSKTLYDVLGVTESSDKTEIAKAYRQKSLLLHPDRHIQSNNSITAATTSTNQDVQQQETSSDAGESERLKRAFQLVQDAYKTLNDDEKRRTYDFARTVGVSQASRESLEQMHMHLATQLLFAGGLGSVLGGGGVGSSTAPPAPVVRKCSCGNSLKNPDDLLCESCGMFKPKNRCKQMGCLNDLPLPTVSFVKTGNVIQLTVNDATQTKRTETTTGMCDKCAFRRKCTVWGCMKKCEAADRDVCLTHHQNPPK